MCALDVDEVGAIIAEAVYSGRTVGV